MQIQQIMSLVQDDFEAVNQLISSQLHSRVPLVETIGNYIVSSGGKRMRPLLVLLIARTLNYAKPENAARLATVIEFLHTATLLHDDVVDTSSLRRGNATANARWGNAPSVLVGDFLYSRAFQLMVELGQMDILAILADSTNVIAEGEVLQLSNCKNPDLSEADYLKVITAKTAMLFEAATHTAACLAGASEPVKLALKRYGCLLGMAFQLADDALDYSGNAEEMGKNVGDDLAEGKTTLPLIHAQRVAGETDREVIRKAIRQGELESIGTLHDIIERSGSLNYTLERARDFAAEARQCLAVLDQNDPFLTALLSLTELAVDRRS